MNTVTNFNSKNNVIYISGVFDLLHESHIRALKLAKAQLKESYFIVGVATDEDTMTYKRKPIIPYEQRLKMIERLDFVDQVVTAPLFLNKQFYDFYDIDLHVQGSDDAGDIDYYKGGKDLGIIKFVGRDPLESTSSCINTLNNLLGEGFSVVPLQGGISNINWKLSSKNDTNHFVLKYLQTSTIESFSARQDCLILGGTFVLYPYIEGVVGSVTEEQVKQYFDRYLERSLSHDKAEGLSELNILTRYLKDDDFDYLKDIGFYNMIDTCKWCWSHNDVNRHNIITNSLGINLIDWEYASLAPLEMDISSAVLNDLLSIDSISEEGFSISFIDILVLFQCKVWVRWYENYHEKSSDEIIDFYTRKIRFHESRIKNVRD
ncbi:adenylyltransferase/cytidyltransferase family protein [Vibrio splendidus]|uniref:adenylyltransferase/cytidyltransferase family protein n=1 Tax=Vibrio splendidus TaxID=29497 RepID=UPI000CAB1987|nr:adenylyltransferase/cytidyltransferase family protein [Vibrio splendidus]PMH04448.1 hypothetical protein BCU77_14475 [Vibrio splendidus]